MTKFSRNRNGVVRSGLSASGVTEKKQQDGVFEEARKTGLKIAGLSPIQWISTTVSTTLLSHNYSLAVLQDTAIRAGVTTALSSALTFGQTVFSKIGEGREGSREMAKDRKAGKDVDTPLDDQVQQHGKGITSLNTRYRRTLELFGKVVRSLKDGQKHTNERLDAVEVSMGDALDQRIQTAVNTAVNAALAGQEQRHQTEIAALQQKVTILEANTDGKLEAVYRHTEERIGAAERRTVSTLNAHTNHVGAELASVREDLGATQAETAGNSELLGKHDGQLREHIDLITEQAHLTMVHGQRMSEQSVKLQEYGGKLTQHSAGLRLAENAFRTLDAKVTASAPPPAPPAAPGVLSPEDAAKAMGVRDGAERLREKARETAPRPQPPHQSPPAQPPPQQPPSSHRHPTR
ncbi:hypothetical protein GCM10009765_05460 [Fodinicola feengrottensis]|uniref:Uncharacterized protein n=1 Tax=Fodinicola feengrottensis TaxID=435914 RepID=A0ABN2FTA2_9ACTN